MVLYRIMFARLRTQRVRAAGSKAGVAVVLLLLLGLELAASSPQLHAMICPQAGQANDYCVIKQFQSGMVDLPIVQAVDVSPPFLEVIVPCWREEFHPAAPLFRLTPSRAPPFEFPPH